MLTIDDITIDPEFSTANRLLTDDERFALEEQIGLHGFRDPLVVWLHHGLLLDGHNRLSIYREHFADDDDGPSPPDIIEMHFPDRAAALQWIKDNQRARRNLTPEEIAYLIGEEYREQKKPEGAPKGNANAAEKQLPHCEGVEETAEKVAEKHGVSRATVERNAQFAEAVDVIRENAGREVADSILSGETDKTRKQVIAIAQLPAEKQAEAMAERRGAPSTNGVSSDSTADALEAFKVVTDSLKDVRKQALDLCGTKCGSFIRKTFVKERFQQIFEELARAVPERGCTICNGEGCMQCRYLGLIPATVYEETRQT